MNIDAKKILQELFQESLEALSPRQAIAQTLSVHEKTIKAGEQTFPLGDTPVYVLSVGKAALPMYEGAREILGEHLTGSLVITSDASAAEDFQKDNVLVGSHPVPDARSLEAGEKAAEFIRTIPHDSLLFCLISGGTSSLMCLPAEGISIGDLNRTFELLNNSGATIHEINAVRKHCSQIKGGQLLRYLDSSVTLVDLVISDVPDDDLAVIGSGPTTPDDSTYQDAYHVLLEYELWDRLPESVHRHIEKGLTGEVPDTLKPEEHDSERHFPLVISSAQKLAAKVCELAELKGEGTIECWQADRPFNDDVEAVAGRIAEKAITVAEGNDELTPPAVLVYYGESTVNVSGQGKGGRNQELALRGALRISGYENICWLSAGTDGIDGPTDAAGALVNGNTLKQAEEKGLNPEEYLENNDAYHFHQELGTLMITGPTGNNLMDIDILLVE